MIVFVYGDELAAAGHCIVDYNWAVEDHFEITKGLRAHPTNIPFGFGHKVAKLLHSGFHSSVLKDQSVTDIVNSFEQTEKYQDRIFLASWNSAHCVQKGLIESFGDWLIDNKIPASFINSESSFESNHPLWIWNTKENNAKKWAKEQNLLNLRGYFNSQAHTLLANLVLNHLTNQLELTII